MEFIHPFLDSLSHNYVQAFFIVLLTLFAVLFARKVMYFLVGKYIANEVVKKDIIPLLEKPVFYTVVTQGLSIALLLLHLPETAEEIALSVLRTLLIIVWALFFLHAAKAFIQKGSRMRSVKVINTQTTPLFTNIANIIIIAMALFYVLSLWGINMTAWLASAGIIGIAVGMAAKDTLANFLSGVFIVADSPYKIGDYLVLESGERGKVTQIGLRSTRILLPSDVELTVPNSTMENSIIKNESSGDHRHTRVFLSLGVAYGTDLEKAEKIVLDIAQKNEFVLKDPAPTLRWREFGASSIDAKLLLWIDNPDGRWKAEHFLIKEIYAAFNENSIEIPYSKQDLYIKEMPGK